MKSAFGAALVALLVSGGALHAEERQVLGYGSMFTNDFLGDGHDRWRSGSYTVSMVKGPEWGGGLPSGFGDLLEYRLQSQIIAPASLTAPAKNDRRYAGVLSFGLHTHFSPGLVDFAVGGDLVAVGPQTGISGFQEWAHSVLDAPSPQPATSNQIGNAVYPTAVASATMPFSLGGTMTSRPFVEVQAGAETLVRVGGDLIFGDMGRGDLMVRDGITGQLYNTTHSAENGVSFLLGGDVAYVAHSAYLPASQGYDLTNARSRLRAGVNWEGSTFGVFYGMTWMGKEFSAQPESQVLGTLNLRFSF